MSLSLLLLRKIKPWLTTWTIRRINQGNLNMYWEEFPRPGNAAQACSSANLLEDSCLTHSELCPVAGSQETLVRLWACKEHMSTEQTPASSLRLRNKISASWALERQAETPNTAVNAKSNGQIFLMLWRSHGKPAVFGIPGWCPVLFRTEEIPLS